MDVKRMTMKYLSLFLLAGATVFSGCNPQEEQESMRERISINDNWQFYKYDSAENADDLIYDIRPEVSEFDDSKDADTEPTEAELLEAQSKVLKPWILPTGNRFVKNQDDKHARPEGNPGSDFPFVQAGFDDSSWKRVDLPHDWAIEGPFYEGGDPPVGGGMGRLPSPGVAWYRKVLDIPVKDEGKSVFLDIGGAMSYAMVWLNGNLVGGWPYGYLSFRLDLTPYIDFGGENQLAIRLDNPPHSSRWYPGGGIYRNVWLTKTNPVHVGQWGTYVTTPEVTDELAKVEMEITIDNDLELEAEVETQTQIFELDSKGNKGSAAVAEFKTEPITIAPRSNMSVSGLATIDQPNLWGPAPEQTPNRYLAVTTVISNGIEVDEYDTRFGIRTLQFDADEGLMVNGKSVRIKGVNQHHDLGALGAAFNKRAAERQLEILHEMGVNAIRIAHNPPATELLELTDSMGFLVVNEIFDVWKRKKTPLDFHLIFPDWYEQDTRAFVRRDRNHPSVISWSFGNEVGEQYTGEEGAKVAARLNAIIKEEDDTRPTTASMNWAKPYMPFPEEMDLIGLNYQGEGIRNAPAYKGMQGITTEPMYPAFHEEFPDKMIFSSETAAAVSSRGTYLFPVHEGISAPVADGSGGDPVNQSVSAYELYTAPFGSSADKVIRSLNQHPYVSGQFVWSGWDYLGEPTPYYGARSSYFGVIDLAGFKKDRFYLYQSQWRPELPMVHILPHWNWPERIGQITPVHVFTSGDEVELFLNDESLGKKKKGEYEYRLSWDDVKYEPGELKAVAWKNGEKWAEKVVQTTGEPTRLALKADRSSIAANGSDLSFITVKVVDEDGLVVPDAGNEITFCIEGPGEIVATDNGNPADMVPFPSHTRKAFSGLGLVIVKGDPQESGELKLKAESKGLESEVVVVHTASN